MSDAFTDIVDGAKSAKDAIGDLLDDLYRQALKFVANQAIMALLKSFTTGGGGWGSVLGNIVGSYFGGAGPGTIGAGLASGGPVMPYSFHEVNERGPELYEQGGRAYLMGGSLPGKVVPLH